MRFCRPRWPALALSFVCLLTSAARAEVRVEGLDRALRANVLANLRLSEETCSSPPWRVQRLFGAAESDIRRGLEAYGYYEPKIEKRLEQTAKCWVARFVISAGEPVRLRAVDVTVSGAASTDPAFTKLIGGRQPKPGDRLSHVRYEELKKALTDLALARGYFEGRFETSRLDVYPAERVADITLTYASGPRYVFGEARIEQDFVEADLVGRYVQFTAGEPYDAARVNDLYASLLSTGYFQTVDVRSTPRPAPDHDVQLTVELTPSKPRTWTAGAGYGTDLGIKLRAGFLNRRFNPRGHQLELGGSWSRVVQEARFEYRIPLDDPRAEWFSFDTGYKNEEPEDSKSEIYEVGVKAIKRRPAGWLETRFVDYSFERFTVGASSGRSNLLVPGLNWSRITTAAPVRPLRAHRVSMQIKGTSEVLTSDANFLQGEIFAKLIRPLGWGFRGLVRGEVGATLKDRFEDLPFSIRYFVGGDYSVRGYDYKSLGPRDETGAVRGGSHKLVLSAEIDRPLWRNKWAGALFVDSGNAFDAFNDMSLKTSVGAGVRWYSPLGPIRLDVGVPLDSDAPDDFRIHVTLGPDL